MKKILTTTLVLLVGLSTNSFSKEKTADKEKEEVKIEGVIQNIPMGFNGTWVINKKNIEINSKTKLNGKKGDYVKGTNVKVEAKLISNKFIAKEIEIEDNNEKKENDK
ncbi:MAG: DUF5666 domain-containing protein [Candidatus Sericytochromatia bacterium]